MKTSDKSSASVTSQIESSTYFQVTCAKGAALVESMAVFSIVF